MSGLLAVRCTQCGGAVQAAPGKPLPACLFCGADAADLLAHEPEADREAPEGAIPFEVSAAEAHQRFVEFAGSSVWYPSNLHSAELELSRLLLPAWSFGAQIEAHYAGLVRANTQSGKRPVTGSERIALEQILVPASATLTRAELAQLGAFRETLRPFDAATHPDPFEISELSRSSARTACMAQIRRQQAQRLRQQLGATEIDVAILVDDMEGRPVLIPVYIGAYRYGDHPYRVLVNGQTGVLIADAPTSWPKVVGAAAAVLLGVAAVVALLALWLS